MTEASCSPPAPASDAVRDPARRRLLVSIINYRTEAMTLACLRALLPELAPLDAEAVVVDNRSDDGSAEAVAAWIAAQDPPVPVRLICSATNSGFSGGHNQAMAACPAEFVLVLNSDAELRPGCLAALLAAAAARPEAGLLAPRLEYADGEPQISCFRFPTPASELIRGAATGAVTRLLRRRDMPLGTAPEAGQIGWASFACIMLRGAMVAAIGPMDAGYFLYFEDIEYCLRARRAGWRVAYVPAARTVHHRGGSAPVKSLAKARRRLPGYYYASRSRFFCQAYGRAGLWTANLAWHLGRAIALGRRLIGRPGQAAIEAEARDIWINALAPLGDSRAVG